MEKNNSKPVQKETDLQLPYDNNMGYRQDSFKILYDLESDHFWFRSRNKLIIWFIAKYNSHAKRYLELGCGTGYVLNGISKAFPSFEVMGSDISLVGLEYAAKRLENVKLLQLDASKTPFCNEFDLIGGFDVIEHIEDDFQVLKEINKALVENGIVIITVPQHQFLWSHADERACHKRRYRVKEVEKLLEQSGFEIIRTTSFITLLFPFMLFSRLTSRNKKVSEVDPADELNLPKAMNYLFERICDIERLLIQMGINLPFGGSRLVIAKKTKELQ